MARLNSLLVLLLLAAPAAAGDNPFSPGPWPGMQRSGNDPPMEAGGRLVAEPCSDTGLMETPPGGRMAAPPGVGIEDLTPFGGRLLVGTETWKHVPFDSPAFGQDRQMPVRFSCFGEGISPPLQWTNLPAETKSLFILVDDVDDVSHNEPKTIWMAYDLPATTGSLPEGAAQDAHGLLAGHQGKNGYGKVGWTAPCPPCGTHRYHFKIYALKEFLGLKAGESRTRVVGEMQDKVVGRGDFLGLVTRRSKP
jgi:Raf kinase inhibitor-like YbhB/YbcL family protein